MVGSTAQIIKSFKIDHLTVCIYDHQGAVFQQFHQGCSYRYVFV